jgi:hypothetical protein
MCDRKCDCQTCYSGFYHNRGDCGNCYTDSYEQCLSGGIHNCRGYVPKNFFKRLLYKLKGLI